MILKLLLMTLELLDRVQWSSQWSVYVSYLRVWIEFVFVEWNREAIEAKSEIWQVEGM